MKKRNGFTLIEIIAVIAILAIILIIAVPKVNQYILDKKRSNFLTTAKNISRQIEYNNMDFINFTKVTLADLNLDGISSSNFDLEKSTAYIEDGEVYVDLIGKGSYSGINACRVQSTSKNIEVQDVPCEEEIILAYTNFTLDLDGGTTSQKINDKYVIGSYLTLDIPQKQNYTFAGWQKVSGNSELTGNRIKFGNETTTIKAIWKEHPILVVNLDGGSTVQEFKDYYIGGTIIDLAKPSKLGYDFTNWKVTSGNGILSGSRFTMGTEDTSLLALYKAHKYTITYDLNGGSNDSTVPSNVDYGNDIYIKSPTKLGYDFTGWTFEGINRETAKYGYSTGNVTMLIGEDTNPINAEYFKNLNPRDRSTVTLNANWEYADYTLTFNYDGGVGEEANKTVTYTKTYGDLPVPTKSGYTFDGWYIGNVKITKDSVVEITNDAMATAKWTPSTYIITYALNGGELIGESSKEVVYDSTYGDLPSAKRDGYVFAGWYIGNVKITENSTVTITSNAELTASYLPLIIQAIYSATDNSLTFINDVMQTKGETYNGKAVTEVYTGFTTTEYDETAIPWYSYRGSIKKVEVIDEIKPTSLKNWFRGFSICTEMNLKKLNTASVTNMYYTFSGMTNIESLDLSNFNTSNVINMGRMFNETNKLKNLNISSFDTSNVIHMRAMFSEASSLTTLDLSHFNTSKVARMDLMFYGMSGLTNLDLSSFNTSNVTNMNAMFQNCTSLISLNLSSFNTLKVTNMESMFNGCSKLTTLDLSSFNTKNVTSMAWMFVNCSELTNLDISNFNTSNVTTMYGMFNTCSKLTTLDLSSFNTLKVTSMRAMFDGCKKLTTLDLSSFNTSNVTNMNAMFQNCHELTNLDLSNFDTSSVTIMYGMFYQLGRATTSFTLKLGNKFNVSKVTDMNNLFYFTCYESTTCSIDLGSAFNTSNVTNMSYMFYQTGYSSTTCSINLGSAFNTKNVTNMESMFNRACSFSTSTTLNLGSNFDTSNVTNMNGMFTKVARNNANFTLDLGDKFKFKDGVTVTEFVDGSGAGKLIIPSTVTSIPSSAFKGMTKLKEIVFEHPSTTTITFPAAGSSTGAFYTSTALSTTVTTTNNNVKNYAWSTDNRTVTFK